MGCDVALMLSHNVWKDPPETEECVQHYADVIEVLWVGKLVSKKFMAWLRASQESPIHVEIPHPDEQGAEGLRTNERDPESFGFDLALHGNGNDRRQHLRDILKSIVKLVYVLIFRAHKLLDALPESEPERQDIKNKESNKKLALIKLDIPNANADYH